MTGHIRQVLVSSSKRSIGLYCCARFRWLDIIHSKRERENGTLFSFKQFLIKKALLQIAFHRPACPWWWKINPFMATVYNAVGPSSDRRRAAKNMDESWYLRELNCCITTSSTFYNESIQHGNCFVIFFSSFFAFWGWRWTFFWNRGNGGRRRGGDVVLCILYVCQIRVLESKSAPKLEVQPKQGWPNRIQIRKKEVPPL